MLARRVLLVDDHPVFRTGLRRVLEATGRYEVVAEAGNAHEAIRGGGDAPGTNPARRPAARHHRAAHHPHPASQADPCAHRGSRFTWTMTESSRRCTRWLSCRRTSAPRPLTAALSRICAGENLLRAELLARPERRGVYAPSCGCRVRLAAAKSRCRSTRELAVLDCVAQGLPTRRSPTSSSSRADGQEPHDLGTTQAERHRSGRRHSLCGPPGLDGGRAASAGCPQAQLTRARQDSDRRLTRVMGSLGNQVIGSFSPDTPVLPVAGILGAWRREASLDSSSHCQ